MSLAVLDASALVAFYTLDDSRHGPVAARLARGDALFAPSHLDAEVIAALRGLSRTSPSLTPRVPAALQHLSGFPLRRMPLAPLLQRIWELRDNLTCYDAAYVSLAERLDGPLVTCDARISRATGPRCVVELIA